MLLLCGTIFVIFASASMSVFTSFVNNVTSVISDEGAFGSIFMVSGHLCDLGDDIQFMPVDMCIYHLTACVL